MKIALAQLNYTIGDFNQNKIKIIDAINDARTAGARIVVFSEMAVCGYLPDDMLDYEAFIDSCEKTIKEITSHTQNITAIVGCPSRNSNAGRKLYNSAFVLENGSCNHIINKTLLPTYDVFSEARYFENNKVFETIFIDETPIAITICEDLWDEMDEFNYLTDPLKNLSEKKPQLLINLSASPFSMGKQDYRMRILCAQSKEFNLPLIYVNQVGVHTDLIFDGNSVLLNGKGEITKQLPAFEECFEVVDFKTLNVLPPNSRTKENELATLHNALVFGIKEYFTKMNFTRAVLGSSGGIDSALVQALASEALGAENVLAVLMPSEFSSDHSLTDAIKLTENLGNPYQILPIKEVFTAFQNTLQPVFEGLPFNVAEENIQARARAVLLMAISNKKGNILLNTSNKSEMSVGYSTLYGDMCGSLSVLGDVYKTTIFQLCEWINRDKEIIPANILTKAPSAELRPNQKDSDSLPDYAILDEILKLYVDNKKSEAQIVAAGFDQEVVNKVLKMVNANEYKRFQAPPILRVSNKAFGRGRVMPLVAKWQF